MATFGKLFANCMHLTSTPPHLFDNEPNTLVETLTIITEEECIPKLYVILFAIKKFEKWQLANQPEISIDDLYSY